MGGGVNSIFIGNNAGKGTTFGNTIILNAAGTELNPTSVGASGSCFITPIRGAVTTDLASMYYNSTTSELTYATSSIKYKKNVIDLTTDTSVLHKLRAREYDSKNDNTHCIGYIAEEVNAIDKNFTWKNPDGTPEGLDWFNMFVYAIEEIKKLRIELNELKGL